jgi:hypothetical protein
MCEKERILKSRAKLAHHPNRDISVLHDSINIWTIKQGAADGGGEDGRSGSAVEGDADVYADGDDEHVGGDVSSCFFDLIA